MRFFIYLRLLLKLTKKNYWYKKVFIILSFIESSLRQSYEIYALINFLVYKLNTSNINFYSTFEANTFEKVLVKLRSNALIIKHSMFVQLQIFIQNIISITG